MTTLGGGTAISGGGTLYTGGGTPFRPVPAEFNHCLYPSSTVSVPMERYALQKTITVFVGELEICTHSGNPC